MESRLKRESQLDAKKFVPRDEVAEILERRGAKVANVERYKHTCVAGVAKSEDVSEGIALAIIKNRRAVRDLEPSAAFKRLWQGLGAQKIKVAHVGTLAGMEPLHAPCAVVSALAAPTRRRWTW